MATPPLCREAWTASRASGRTTDSGIGVNSDSESGEVMSEKKVTFPEDSNKTSQWYGKLCALLVEGTLIGYKDTFNILYPPINLADKLATPDLRNRLQLLRTRGILDEHQWKKLYPKNKKRISSEHYDLMLLSILLRRICHLAPPYPNGWNQMPEMRDISLSSNIARINVYRKELLLKTKMTDSQAMDYWSEVVGTLLDFGGQRCLMKSDKIYREVMSEETQQLWASRLQAWHDKEYEAWNRKALTNRQRHDSMVGEVTSPEAPLSDRGLTRSRSRQSLGSGQTPRAASSRLRRGRIQSEEEGLPREERETLQKFYKPLITNVKATDILEPLIKNEILTQMEQNAIYCIDKNRQRMDHLIKVLQTKPASAYEHFVKAIKFKHSHLYEMMQKTHQGLKKESVNSKPDSLRHTSEILRMCHRLMCSQWKPMPWLDNVQTSLREFYTKQQIIGTHGESVELEEMFENADAEPQSILIIGQSGTGKTTLCKRLVYDWMTENKLLYNIFHLVFYVDLFQLRGSLKDYLYEQFSAYHFNLEKDELWSLIETHQADILFIFDDYSPHGKVNEVDQIVNRKMLPNTSFVVTSTTAPSFHSQFQTCYMLLGLARRNITDLVQRYMEATGAPLDQISMFFQALQNETLRELAVKPFFCLCLCTLATHGVEYAKITTETTILDYFLSVIRIKTSGNTREFRNLGARSITQIQQAALQASMTHTKVLSYDRLQNEYDNTFIYSFGLLNQKPGSDACTFVCKVLQDFLTAQFLKGLELNEFKEHCEMLATDPWFYDVCRYVCGLRKTDNVHEPLGMLVSTLADENVKHSKKICFEQSRKGEIIGISEGQISSFTLSLECVYEMKDCRSMVEIVSKSLPEKLVMRLRGLPNVFVILGLTNMLKMNLPGPKYLDILFDRQMDFVERAMMHLATALHSNFHVKFLRVEWKSHNMFAQFLSQVFRSNMAIECVKLVDTNSKESCSVSATVRADVLQACKSMKYVRKLTLLNCRKPMFVNSVIHGIPPMLEELDFTGCEFNPVTSQELSFHLEYTKSLRILNLTGLTLKGMCFRYMMKGLRQNKSLYELILRDINLDKPGVMVLAEALKFNHHLRILDLSRNDLTREGCIHISHGLSFNKTLRELVLLGSWLEPSLLHLLMTYKHPMLRVIEDSSRPLTASIVAD